MKVLVSPNEWLVEDAEKMFERAEKSQAGWAVSRTLFSLTGGFLAYVTGQ